MPNIMDYLAWRGDVSLAYSPFNEVDSLVLSALSYLNYPDEPTLIRDLGVHVPAVDKNQFAFVHECRALLSAAVYAFLSLRGRKKTFAVTKKPILAALGAGCSLACFLALNTYAARVIDGSFHYPAHSGGAILLSTLSGVLLFRDKLSARQIVACILGICSIVLMNF